MNPSDKTTAKSLSCKRRRFVLLALLAIVVAILWRPGTRLYFYLWMTKYGYEPWKNTDFTRFADVMPPPDAQLVAIYRGLPHQVRDNEGLWRDLFNTSIFTIGGYRFYTTPISLDEFDFRTGVTSCFQNPWLYAPFAGPKLCDGYHPDLCFEWRSSQGAHFALVCTGCGEAILIGNGREIYCEFSYRSDPEFECVIQHVIEETDSSR